jgi:hypothetical protein
MSVRYVSIPPGFSEILVDLQLNATGIANVSTRGRGLPQYAPLLPSPAQIPSEVVELVLIVSAFLLVLVMVFLYIRSSYRAHETLSVTLDRREPHELFPTVNYVYKGVKSILRKYLTLLRSRVGCSICTPREVSHRLGFLKKFVEVYEDVVYGDKQRLDIDEALQEVRRGEE